MLLSPSSILVLSILKLSFFSMNNSVLFRVFSTKYSNIYFYFPHVRFNFFVIASSLTFCFTFFLRMHVSCCMSLRHFSSFTVFSDCCWVKLDAYAVKMNVNKKMILLFITCYQVVFVCCLLLGGGRHWNLLLTVWAFGMISGSSWYFVFAILEVCIFHLGLISHLLKMFI